MILVLEHYRKCDICYKDIALLTIKPRINKLSNASDPAIILAECVYGLTAAGENEVAVVIDK